MVGMVVHPMEKVVVVVALVVLVGMVGMVRVLVPSVELVVPEKKFSVHSMPVVVVVVTLEAIIM
jgi:hypothetical protein